MSSPKKIAIIVQRYGQQVNGGAEVHAKMIATQLSKSYQVTILTSCAVDYQTWQPVFPEGITWEDGIEIIRFTHPAKEKRKFISKVKRKYTGNNFINKVYKFLREPVWFKKLFTNAISTEADGEKWLALQGPAMYNLLPYLQQNVNTYAAFIFFTYLYYPTVKGLPLVANKSILIQIIFF